MAGLKRFTPDEVSYFCEQILLVINAGIPLDDGMEILSEDIDDANIRLAAKQISGYISEGMTLFDAMEKTGAFQDYVIKMIKIGMYSGRIEDVLRGLTDYYESRSSILHALRSAVLHPLLLIAMMTAVIVVLIVQVIPMFADIFSRFDSSVSETVMGSISYANTIGFVLLIILLAVVVISVVIALLSAIKPCRDVLGNLASHFFITKKMYTLFSEAKFTEAMSMMISSGIDAVEALEYADELISDKKLKKRIADCRDRVLGGESFADAVCSSRLLRPVYARSIKIAYKSGSFEKVWKKISSRSSYEAEASASNLVAFIEPVLVGVLVSVIGSVMLTIMLPMVDIMSVLG